VSATVALYLNLGFLLGRPILLYLNLGFFVRSLYLNHWTAGSLNQFASAACPVRGETVALIAMWRISLIAIWRSTSLGDGLMMS